MRWALLILLVSGCGSSVPHALVSKEYSHACADVVDCVAVYVGPLSCCGGGCPNDSINEADFARYTSDVSVRTPTCNVQPPCFAPPTNDFCGTGRLACVNSVCTLESRDGGETTD
jgi:hypothetical protein